MPPQEVDLIIVGAGPVGLYFAHQMALRGHSIFCVDIKPGPTDQSRAVLVGSRTMDIFDTAGFAENIVYESYLASGVRIHRNETSVSTLNAAGDSKFSHLSLISQGKIESIIYNRLEELGYTVHWETELISYTQYDDYVMSIVRDLRTKEETIVKSSFIIGADGSHSRVRKHDPTWKYDGISIATQFCLADVTFKTMPLKLDKTNAFSKGADVLGFIPLNLEDDSRTTDRCMYRIITNLGTYSVENSQERITHGLQEDAPSIELIQSHLNKKAKPYVLEIKDIFWSSYFKINERMVNGYRRQRAFLVGDSAHCHSPAGGQGLNLGIQDANNLAWKISSVLRGIVSDPEKLLESYSVEREPHARKVLQNTSAGTKYGNSDSSVAEIVLASVLSFALSIPTLNRYSFRGLMQQHAVLDTGAKDNAYIDSSDKGLIQIGTYLPPMGYLRKSYALKYTLGMLQPKSLQEVISESNDYTLLFVSTSYSNYYPFEDLIKQFWISTRGYPVRRLVIRSSWHVNQMKYLPEYIKEEEASAALESFYSEISMESSESITKKVGLEQFFSNRFLKTSDTEIQPKALILIRPDLHVASSKIIYNEQELNKALAYLDSIFVK